jgi:hypothetical protein
MATLGFPSNPYIGQTYTIGTRTWEWNGNGWAIVSGITSYDPFTAVSEILTTSTNSTGTNTGALIVAGGVGIGEDVWIGGNLWVEKQTTFAGSVVFNGTATYVYSTNTFFTDNIIELHVPPGGPNTPWTFDDGKDIGLRFHYFNRSLSTNSNAALILADDSQNLEWYNTGAELNGDFTSATYGTFKTGNIQLVGTGTSTSTQSGSLTVQGGIGVIGNLYGDALYDSNRRVISRIDVGNGLGESQGSGPIVLLTNTGVLSITGIQDISVTTSTGNVVISDISTLQSVTARGATSNQIITLTNTSASSNTQTGALIVTGGIGVGGNLYGNALFDQGSRVVTQATLGSYGVTTLTAGTDTAVSTSTGPVVVWDISTFQSVTGRGNSTTNAIIILNTSTSSLLVSGGASFGGNIEANFIYGSSLYDSSKRVVTEVIPTSGPGIGISGATTVGPQVTFAITNLGVQAITTGSGIAISTSTGTVNIQSIDTLESVTLRGATSDQIITLTNTASSISSLTGALVITGGVGIGGSLYAGNMYSNNSQVLTQASIGSYGVTSLTAGTDISVNTTTGAVTVSDISTFQSVTGRGNSTTNAIVILNTSTSSLTVAGSAIISGNETLGGILAVNSIINSIGSGTGALQVAGGASIVKDLYIGGTSNFSGPVNILNTTASTSTTTGALIVDGGVGVAGNLWIGGAFVYSGQLYDTNSRVITTSTIAQYAVTTLTAGTDTVVSTSTGPVVIWNTSTLASITGRGATTPSIITITNTTTNTSTSFTSGNALIVAGSIGANSINLSTSSYINGAQILTTVTGVIAQFNGGTIGNPLIIATGTQAVSTGTGALVVNGGVGIGGNLWVGGTTNFEGSVIFNGTATYVFASQNYYTENLIILHATSSTTGANNWTFDDGKDVGIIGDYYNTSLNTATQFFMGWRHGTGSFEFFDFGSQNTAGNFVGLYGDITAGNFYSQSTANSISTTTGAITTPGGVGIGSNLNVGGTAYVQGSPVLTLANLSVNTLTFYVSVSNGNDSNNGLSSLQPFATIGKALSVASNGSEVYIDAGTYTETFPLTVPAGVTVRGAGLRSTIVQPTSITNTQTGFLLNGQTLVSDITVSGFYKPGYGFAFAPNCMISTKSPYLQRISVITKGSVQTTIDPYGYGSGNAGNGVYLDASVLAPGSLEPAMLFNEVTFIVPNATGMYMTNGVRAELLNGFFYFANQAVYATSGNAGVSGAGQTRLKLAGVSGSFNTGDTISYRNTSGSVVASGTISNVANGYIYINGPSWGFTAGNAVNTQTVYSSSGGTASYISLADYHQFGAELRCIGSAAVFGNSGVTANGTGTDLKLIAFNMSFIGSQGNLTDDDTLTVQLNEVIQTNGGIVYYQTVDQEGNFRVGKFFEVNENTGVVSFSTASIALTTASSITLTDGTLYTILTPGNAQIGQVNIGGTTVGTLSGNLNLAPASGLTLVNGSLQLSGTLTVPSTTQAVSTMSGAVIVTGGVGIGGNLYAGNMYSNGSQVLTYGTLASAGVSAILPGTDISVTTSTGVVTINNISTLNSTLSRGSSTYQSISITGTGILSVATTVTAGQVYDNGARVITTATIATYAVTSLIGGIDITVTTSTGIVTINDASTLQSVTNRGQTTNNAISITNTSTNALSVTGTANFLTNVNVTGTLSSSVITTPLFTATTATITYANITTASVNTITVNGLTVTSNETDNGTLNVGGLVNFSGLAASTSTYTGILVVAGGVGIGGTLNAAIIATPVLTATNATITYANITTASISTATIGSLIINTNETDSGTLNVGGVVQFTNTSASTSTLTGALQVTGGVGIQGTLNAGIIVTPVLTATSITVTTLNVTSTETDTGALTVGGIVQFTNTTSSTSTTTGAVLITGGLGIQGNLYGGNIYSNGAQVLTQSSLGGFGVTALIAGTDTSVSTSTGNVVIWNTSTLQSITSRGSSTNQVVTFANASVSNNTTSGAVIITGGVGIGGAVNIGGNVTATNFTAVASAGTATVRVVNSGSQIAQIISDPTTGPALTFGTSPSGSLYGSLNAPTGYITLVAGSARDIKIYGAATTNSVWISNSTGNVAINKGPSAYTLDVGGTLNVSSTASSTGTAYGALVVAGGIGIGGGFYASTSSYINGAIVLTSATVNQYASQTIISAGTDTAVSTSTGNVTIWDISTLQSVTSRGNSTTNVVILNSTTYSTNTIAGNTLQIPTGGIGTNFLYIANAGFINGQQIVTTATANAAVTAFNGGTITTPLYINTTTVSTGTSSGALIVGGGVGIAGSLYVGGTTYLSGDLYVDGTQTVINSVLEATQDKTLTLGNSLLQASTNGAGIQIGSTATPFISWLYDGVNNWKSSNGILVTNTATIGSGTIASSTTTGALIVSGGAGITGTLFVGGVVSNNVTATNVSASSTATINYANITTASILTATISTLIVNSSETNNGTLTVAGQVTFNTSTNSTSTSSGGVIVKGGLGIAGNAYVGGYLAVVTTATVQSATSATSTLTGALVVTGGVGVGGALYAGGNMYANGAMVLTTATLGGSGGVGVTTLTAGTDTAVSAATGAVTVWSTSTLQSITSRGATTPSAITITNGTASTSTLTGALIVAGGIGIGNNIIVGAGAIQRGEASLVLASGSFVNPGDAQSSVYTLRVATVGSTPSPLTADGAVASAVNQVVMPNNSVFTFRVLVTAKSTTNTDNAGWEFNGVATRGASAATTTLQRVNKDKIWYSNSAWDVNVTVDTTNGAIQITGTGDGVNNVRFVARIETAEVTN